MRDLETIRPDAGPRGRLALAVLLVALGAACASGRPAVRPAPETTRPPNAMPQREAQLGEASYYHPSLEGRLTASGVPYRAEELTCAHRTLPFGTRVRLTRLDEARSVLVVVNDRGPFVRGRIVDLSMAAARRLQMIEKGHVPVRLEVLQPPAMRKRARAR